MSRLTFSTIGSAASHASHTVAASPVSPVAWSSAAPASSSCPVYRRPVSHAVALPPVLPASHALPTSYAVASSSWTASHASHASHAVATTSHAFPALPGPPHTPPRTSLTLPSFLHCLSMLLQCLPSHRSPLVGILLSFTRCMLLGSRDGKGKNGDTLMLGATTSPRGIPSRGITHGKHPCVWARPICQ